MLVILGYFRASLTLFKIYSNNTSGCPHNVWGFLDIYIYIYIYIYVYIYIYMYIYIYIYIYIYVYIYICMYICDWACENQAYLHKLHMFRKRYISWCLCMINNFCKLYIIPYELFNKSWKFHFDSISKYKVSLDQS